MARRYLSVLAVVCVVLSACGSAAETAVPAEVRVVPTATPSPQPSATSTATLSATPSPTSTVTPTATPTEIPSPTPTAPPTATEMPTATATPAHTATPSLTPTATATPAPTNTRGPTNTPRPTSTLSAAYYEGRLSEVAHDTRPPGCDSCTVEYHSAGYGLPSAAIARCRVTSIWTVSMAMETSARAFLDLAPAAWGAAPDLGVLTVYYDAEFVDNYGKTAWQPLLTIQVTAETAAKIAWDNMTVCRLAAVADACTPHSSERAAWAEVCP